MLDREYIMYWQRCVTLIFFAIAFPGEGAVTIDEVRLKAYQDDIAAVEKNSYEFAQQHGKEALIQRYRNLLRQYPGFPRSVYLEFRIGQICEWDLPDRNEPSDRLQAVETYESILRRYDPHEPYMKRVALIAADRAKGLDSERARRLYEHIMDTYPDDDGMRLEGYVALAGLAWGEGRFQEAEEYLPLVLMYDPTALPSRSEEYRAVVRAQQNAAIHMFWLSFQPPFKPLALQLADAENTLKRYPQIELWHWDIIIPIIEDLRARVKEEANAKEKSGSNREQ
jgi:hypothetical protein